MSEKFGSRTISGVTDHGGSTSAQREVELEALVGLLHQIGWHSRRMFAEILEQHGLNFSHWLVLELVAEAQREGQSGLTMRSLADQVGAAPSSLTGMVDPLVKRGLVERRADPNDRRVIPVALTRAGEALTSMLRQRMNEAYREPMAQMNLTDLRFTREVLERMLTWYISRRGPNEAMTTRVAVQQEEP